MNKWLKFTDRYGAVCFLKKDMPMMIQGSSISEGDGEKTITIMGTMVHTYNGAALFVTEPPEEVIRQQLEPGIEGADDWEDAIE